MKLFKFLILLSVTTFCQNASAEDQDIPAREKDHDAIWSISMENDAVFNKDSNYTNGFRVSYMSPETVPYWLERSANVLPLLDIAGNKRWGFAVGQNIYTPNDISLSTPPLTDRPYAGWLYGTATLISDNTKTLDTFQLTLGIVGPSALGEPVQDSVHNLIDYQQPQGWDHQLKDEPGIILGYDRKWRSLAEFSPFGFGADITPSVGMNLGNVDTSANIGLMARLGRDLPSDYGPPLIKPSISGSDFFVPTKKFGWYIFGGIEGRAVAQNIFLDGNSFRESPSVDKNIFVGGVQYGIAFTFNDMRISYTQVQRTKEYKTQTEQDQYGAITLSFRF